MVGFWGGLSSCLAGSHLLAVCSHDLFFVHTHGGGGGGRREREREGGREGRREREEEKERGDKRVHVHTHVSSYKDTNPIQHTSFEKAAINFVRKTVFLNLRESNNEKNNLFLLSSNKASFSILYQSFVFS